MGAGMRVRPLQLNPNTRETPKEFRQSIRRNAFEDVDSYAFFQNVFLMRSYEHRIRFMLSFLLIGCSSTVVGTHEDDAGVSTIVIAEQPKSQDYVACLVSGECASGCCEPQLGNGQGLCQLLHEVSRANPQDC